MSAAEGQTEAPALAGENSLSPTARTWHWHSTPMTTELRQMSVASLLETIVTVAVYAWLAIQGHTVHLVLSACLSPFLLLRTQESTNISFQLGRKMLDGMKKLMDSVEKQPTLLSVAIIFFWIFPITSIGFLGIRIFSTAYSFFRHPLHSIASIPANWWKIVGCMDTWHPPETLPGYFANRQHNSAFQNAFIQDESVFAPANILKEISLDREPIIIRLFAWFFFFPMIAVLFIAPSMIFRFSLKASSIIYLPLLWIAYRATGGTFEDNLRVTVENAKSTAQRLASVLTLVFLSGKAFFMNGLNQLVHRLNDGSTSAFLQVVVAPLEIPKWQIASGINSCLAWVIYWIADDFLKRKSRVPGHEPGKLLEYSVRTLWLISASLSIYTIIIMIYNVFTIQWEYLPIGEKWFPWQ